MTTTTYRPPSRGRLALSAVAIAATLPYLTLKISWLLGGRAGLADPAFGRSATMAVANLLTFAMEACAAALALAFVTRWGHRLPAYVVLLPMWIATGLLGAILVILPLQLALTAAGPAGGAAQGARRAPGPIEDWVYAVVYSGFTVLGLALLTGFALFASERWLRPLGWDRRLGAYGPLGAGARQIGYAVAGAALLLGAGEAVTGAHAGPGLANTIGSALLAVAAAAGVAALALRRPRRVPGTVPLVAAWAGSGALATWGLYTAVLLLVPNDLATGEHPTYLVGLSLAKVAVGAAAAVLLRLLRPLRADPGQGASSRNHVSIGPAGSGARPGSRYHS